MKYGLINAKKIYFSSSEVAEQIGVSVSILHSWEKEFTELRPKKNRTGKRLYKQNDVDIAKKIKEKTNFSELKGKIKKEQNKLNTKNKKISVSQKQVNKDFLLKIRDDLQNILEKINRKNQ